MPHDNEALTISGIAAAMLGTAVEQADDSFEAMALIDQWAAEAKIAAMRHYRQLGLHLPPGKKARTPNVPG